MRHQKRTAKLGRERQHRDMMLANMVLSLIEHGRIKTTLARAKALRPLAEKIVTLGKKGDLHHRRLAIAKLKYTRPVYKKGKKRPDLINKLFEELAPKFEKREGGYTRIIKLGPRQSDSAPVALIEWVENFASTEADAAAEATEAKKKPAAKKAEAPAKAVEAKVEQTPETGAKQTSEVEAQAAPVEDAEVVTDEGKKDKLKDS